LYKNICIVTPSFYGGGAEKIAVNLANYYTDIGRNVSIVAFKAKGPYLAQVSTKVKIIDLNSKTRYVFFKLLSVLRREKSDLVISVIRDSNIFVGLSSYFIKAKIIFREANTMDNIINASIFKKLLYLFLMRRAYKKAHAIIANSNDTKKDLLKNKITTDLKIKVIGNPVLPSNFSNLKEEKINHIWLGNKKYKTILNVGRLHRQKNQQLLIDAFNLVYSKIPNSRLVILGEGKEKEALIADIKSKGLDEVVDIIPFQNNPYPYYQAANLFVMSSDWEGFGNVIVEAMASSTPVISTDCPGGPKMILNNGEFGTLVEPKNVRQLASSIISEFSVETDSDSINKAKLRAMEYSLNRVAEKYLAVLF